MSNQAFAFNTSFTTKLNTKAIDNYTEFLASIGVPSDSKLGVVFDIVHAFPFINANGHGFTADVLRNSASSFLNSLIDINHERNYVCGTIVKVDLIEDDTSPLTLRLVGVLDKQILRDWGIEDLLNEDWSMECLYNEYCYSIGNKVCSPQDLPEIDKQFNDIASGQAVYDQKGNRIGLLLGGKNGKVDFNRCGLIIWGKGADQLAETHLQVAKDKNKGVEKMSFKIFETEADYDAAIASLKQEAETNLNQSIASKDQEIADLKATASELEGKYNAEKERADKAEAKLNEQATAKMIEDRKLIVASKNYELDEDDAKFIAEASQDEFDKFVKQIEKIQASASKQLEAKAEKLGLDKSAFASISLTGNDDVLTNEKKDKPKIVAF